MHPISNVEFMLLQMIAECRQASGYDIKKLVDQRGYREWANIGTTSIYVGLRKLSDKGWIASEESDEKSGKGPVPTRFVLTEAGMVKLKDEVLDSLSSARERDNRFDLGLAALPLIGNDMAIAALRKRLDFLREASEGIKLKFESQGGVRLPLNVRALFLHPISLMESEQAFVASLINELSKETREDDHKH
ncbi:PadR family transcriptional regulator [Paenibacillus sp. FSL H8-0457]|uniref:PadR family transcriptional regulator n=1 Tax=Paenibacillus TaxID=44249 RepID=UPI00017896A0|nr:MULTISPECIES: PadR family transcriptional regulator [Paenibacillus]ACX63433.1 transcriptional regulator, PadR-like family [Paenibacillus sp. Y412MC10]ETT64488.1 PadR-like family transcriptional regulator [Paenibacillus sp. FSL H8-457]MCM3260565.1 PadR family transcriptional regulator [Paenibacillus lautus]